MHLVAALLFVGAITFIEPFNVDLTVPLLKSYTGNAAGTDIAFGASVAIRTTQGGSTTFLVGAPKGNHTGDPKFQNTGAVFQCDIDGTSTCDLKQQADSTITFPGQDVNRTAQLFGQTMLSVKGRTIICAPRYQLNRSVIIGTGSGQTRLPSYYAIGRCLAYADQREDFNQAQKYLVGPCQSRPLSGDDSDDYTQCGLGLGVDIDKDGEFFGFGAPGSVRGTGDVFYADWQQDLQGEEINQNPVHYSDNRKDGLITNYLGYSVGLGKFSNTGNRLVAGAPKRNDYKGEVLMFRRDDITGGHALTAIDLSPPLIGEQFGAMFGYALAIADLDGSGLSDVIVSAPFYGSLNKINAGRIYVYKLKADLTGFDLLGAPIDGQVANGMFGLAMSTLGDINLDGFDDIAVSAPFEGNGAVYIYNGYSGGLRLPPQKIESSNLPGMMTSFGFSVSKGEDVDKNNYPDFVVGAYQSNKAILLRSRPIVIVHTLVRTNVSSIQILDNVRTSQGFGLDFCVRYENRRNADPIPNLKVSYELELDQGNVEQRLETKDSTGNFQPILRDEADLTPDTWQCYNITVRVKQNIRDKSSRFVNKLTVSLPSYTNDAPTAASPSDLPTLYPIIDSTVPSFTTATVRIARDCPLPPADKCTPDLIASFTSTPGRIVAGSDELIEISMKVENNYSEASFQTQLIIEFPTDHLVYINYTISNADTPLLGCSSHVLGAVCDIGNPLPEFSSRSIKISLQQKRDAPLVGNEGTIMIRLNATSEDGDAQGRSADNIADSDISVVAIAKLALSGLSQVTSVRDASPTASTDSSQPAEDPRPEIIIQPEILRDILSGKPIPDKVEIAHRYSVRNTETTTIPRVEAEFWFPYFDVRNEVVLIENITAEYSLSQTGKCDVTLNDQSSSSDECADSSIVQCAHVSCNVNQDLVRLGVLSISIKGQATLARITRFVSTTPGSNLISADASLTSTGNAKIVAEYIDENPDDARVKTSIVFTIQTQECVQLWYIVVSVIGSLLVLTVIIIILYSLGFFKMKRRYNLSEGGMISKDQGPKEAPARYSHASNTPATPPPAATPQKEPPHHYEEARRPASPKRQSQTSLPTPVKEFDEEPVRRMSRTSATAPGFKVYDEELKPRRPSSPGSMGEGGVGMKEFDREPRRSVGSGGGYRHSGNDVDGRSREPTSPRKYTETIM